MLDHMTLHAHSNPLTSHSRPSNASEHSGGCRSLLRQGQNLATAGMQHPLYSVGEVIGNSKKMLKP